METPPPLPPQPRRKSTLVLASLLAVACSAFAIYQAWQYLAPIYFPVNSESAGNSAPAREPSISLPLREIDVDRLASQYLNKQDYFQQLDTATLAEYDRANSPDAPWFAEGRQAVRLFTAFLVWNDFYGQGILQVADAYASAAWKNGCRDPLVESICDAYVFRDRHSVTNDHAQGHIRNTRNLLASNYPALFKFVATGLIFKNLLSTCRTPEDARDDMSASFADIPQFVTPLGEQFTALLKENLPADLLYFRTADLFDCVDDAEYLPKTEHEIETAFARESPTHPARAALRGDFLVAWAWQARGSGWADTVTEKGWRLMADRLDQAHDVLSTAYDNNPADYLAASVMLTVELGQGNGRDEMEKWFERAIKAYPDNFMACKNKAWYLQPRWYGSPRDAVDFGGECVETGNWKAKFPLVLTIGIRDMADQQEDLYKDDSVWKLVSPVYEEFLKRYPDSICIRTEYADCAARGERWDVLRDQLKQLGLDWDRSHWSDSDYRRISRLAKDS